jgi:hypothetical protein
MSRTIQRIAWPGICISCVGLSVALLSQAQARPVKAQTDRSREQLAQLENQVHQFDVREANGKLASVATERLEITLQTSQGTMLFTLTPTTRVDLGTMQGTMADLRQGMQVRVFYLKRDKQNMAQSILVEARIFTPDIGGNGSGTPEADRPARIRAPQGPAADSTLSP